MWGERNEVRVTDHYMLPIIGYEKATRSNPAPALSAQRCEMQGTRGKTES